MPDPGPLVDIALGHWKSRMLDAAVEHGLFDALADSARAPDALAEAVGLSPRGTRALLDGLCALGLVEREGEAYRNAAVAQAFLVRKDPRYLGEFIRCHTGMAATWASYSASVRSGQPAEPVDTPENSFWERLVTAIAPLAAPVARQAATLVDLAAHAAPEILDIGGGSGIFSAELLRACPQARATQLDWANVNAVARDFVGRLGVGDRFSCLDGDFHRTDFGGPYALVVYSNIAHQESPASNIEIFGRIHAALGSGGQLLISDFIVDDDRRAPPFALFFASNMLLHTPEGNAWSRREYAAWLREAGFEEPVFHKTPGPSTLVLARRG